MSLPPLRSHPDDVPLLVEGQGPHIATQPLNLDEVMSTIERALETANSRLAERLQQNHQNVRIECLDLPQDRRAIGIGHRIVEEDEVDTVDDLIERRPAPTLPR